MAITVRDNPTEHRYEIHDGDQLAGFTAYKLTGDEIAFIHTEIDPAFARRGLAKVLDDAHRRGLAVLPFCPCVRRVIAQNAETYLHLVPTKDRARFDLPAS